MSINNALEHGWFVASIDQQQGPLSATEALRLVAGLEGLDVVQIWHPSFKDWRTIAADAPGSGLAPPKLNLREFRLINAKFLTWIACGALPMFVLTISLAREYVDGVVLAIIASLFCFSGWWFYLEHLGLRLSSSEIKFPQRIAIWPFPALWPRKVRIADISGFECWSRGSQIHWFKLNLPNGSVQLLVDDALHREILVLSLEKSLPTGYGARL